MSEYVGEDPRNLEERLLRWYRQPVLSGLAFRLLKWRGIDIPTSVEFGEGVRLAHGAVGLVVHPATLLGDRVKLYQGVTIGRSDTHLPRHLTKSGGRVVIGDDVVVGANAVILFRSGATLTIGDGAVIGAGSVLNRSVPAGEVWAGNPAKPVRPRLD